MSATTEFRALTDLAKAATESEKCFNTVGLSRTDIDLFASAWGKAVVEFKTSSQRPVSAVFLLYPNKLSTAVSTSLVAQRVAEVRESQPRFEVLSISVSGALLSMVPIESHLRTTYPGGRWTHAQASGFSLIVKDAAVVWVSGYEFRVFIHGHLGIAFSDVSNLRTEHADELSRRMPLNAEFFDALAKHLLQHGTETGIWRIAEHRVLVPRPEIHIEERMVWFMTAFLSGYTRHTRQHVDASNGRIDVTITFSDGVTQIIELKWIGRALKKTHAGKAEKEIAKLVKRNWKCAAVTVLEAKSIKAGLVQLGVYLQNPDYDRGMLVVIDCRDQPTDISISKAELTAAKIAHWQFQLADVKLDPRPPSVIGRASLRTAS